jgi:hypothetical protein
MVRDPYWCHAYWDVSPELMAQKVSEVRPEWGGFYPALRVYDVTDTAFDGTNARSYFDIRLATGADNWYINIPEPGCSYIVDMGLKTEKGPFIVICRSNIIHAPSDHISEVLDEEWMSVDGYLEELFNIKGLKPGSSEKMREYFEQQMAAMVSSGAVSSFSSPAGGEKKERGFFLIVDTDLILYGATEKDASLTVKGEKVNLKPDGSFSIRYHLPDTTMELPVEAVSRDGVEKRGVTIKVVRNAY